MSWQPDLLRPYAMKPWPMEPHALASLISHGQMADTMAPPTAGPRLATKIRGAIAVIPLEGVIVPWKAEAFADAVLSASSDGGIGAIVLAIDSPGGTIGGVPEAAEAIRSVRGTKPLVAVSTGLMASAAYWLGSAAKKIVASPSAYAGSLGVWTAHADISEMLKAAGVSVTLISAGKYKTEGSMFEPLSEGAKAHLQEDVDDAYDDFIAAVAKHRGVSQASVREGYGEGRVLNATRSVKAGLVDDVGTMGMVLEQLSPSNGRNAGTLRRKLDLDAA